MMTSANIYQSQNTFGENNRTNIKNVLQKSADNNPKNETIFGQTSVSQENLPDNLIKIGGISLLGYATNGETTIMGKFLGYDKTMSSAEVADLQNFLYENSLYGLNGAIYLNDETRFLLDSTMSVEDFKTMWLEYKTITEQGGIWIQTKNEMIIDASKQEPKENKDLFQVVSKSQVYKNLDIQKTQNLLQDTQKLDAFNILFGANTSLNSTDLSTNLMSLNLSKIKPLNKVDIKA